MQTLLTLVDFATIGLLLSLASAGQVMLRLVSAGGQGSRLHRPPGRPWRVSGTGRAGRVPRPAWDWPWAQSILALVVTPLVLLRAGLRHWLLFVATLAVVYAPFVLAGATDFASLLVFAREREFNSAVFESCRVVRPGCCWVWPAPCSGAGTLCATGPTAAACHAGTGCTACCWRCHRSSIRGICCGCALCRAVSERVGVDRGHHRLHRLCHRA